MRGKCAGGCSKSRNKSDCDVASHLDVKYKVMCSSGLFSMLLFRSFEMTSDVILAHWVDTSLLKGIWHVRNASATVSQYQDSTKQFKTSPKLKLVRVL